MNEEAIPRLYGERPQSILFPLQRKETFFGAHKEDDNAMPLVGGGLEIDRKDILSTLLKKNQAHSQYLRQQTLLQQQQQQQRQLQQKQKLPLSQHHQSQFQTRLFRHVGPLVSSKPPVNSPLPTLAPDHHFNISSSLLSPDPSRPFTILVTGAAGFIGSRFIESCKYKNIKTLSVDKRKHFETRKEHNYIQYGTILEREVQSLFLVFPYFSLISPFFKEHFGMAAPSFPHPL
jgi:hypothetical protein